MKMDGNMEVVSFQMAAGTLTDTAIRGIRALKDYYSREPGFRNLQAAQGKDGSWTLVLHWDSCEAEKKASAAMMASQDTDDFKKLVIPHTVSKKMFRCWL